MREIKQYNSFKAAILETIGTGDVTAQSVSGGDINCAYRLSGNGQLVFMKANREKNIDFFVAEVAGLRAIAVTRTIRVPEVLAIGRDDKHGAFLLLEWSRGTPSAEFFENFGHRLAEMHKAETGGIVKGFGFSMDNFIGAGKQENTPKENWTDFFRDHRLVPQLRKADYWFDSTDRKRINRLLDNLGDYLPGIHLVKDTNPETYAYNTSKYDFGGITHENAEILF